jgi:hypothetical protein
MPTVPFEIVFDAMPDEGKTGLQKSQE